MTIPRRRTRRRNPISLVDDARGALSNVEGQDSHSASSLVSPEPCRSPATSAPFRHGFYRRHEASILGGAAVLVTVGVWQALWSAGRISPLFMSGPSAIARQFYELWTHGPLVSDIVYSGRNFAVGFAMAVLAGVSLGIVVGWYRRVRLLADPFLSALYATPRIAMVPLIIIWFGIGMWSKVVIVFLSAFFPILVNTVAGVRAIDADLLQAARAYCASDWQIFTTLALPGSVPFILTGVRQGVALGLIGVVVGEMFGGSQGVGFMVAYGGQTFATDTLFVGVVIIAGAGILLTSLAERLERRFSRWRPQR
jgi:ABC-type nitrate/sulfonate/bicarbonate transport system permease component